MKKIKLIIIEDSKLFRDGLKSMFTGQPGFEIMAAIGDSINVIEKLKDLKAEIILLDISLIKQNSLILVKQIKKNFPKLKIIVMNLLPVQPDIKQYIEEGINGSILKNAATEDLLDTIRKVADGEMIFPSNPDNSLFTEIVDEAVNEIMESKLVESIRMTDIEKKIIDFVASGMTDKEISNKLNTTVIAVKSNIDNILEKMSLSSRVQIAIYKNSGEESEKSTLKKKPDNNLMNDI